MDNMSQWWLTLGVGQQLVFVILGIIVLGLIGDWILNVIKEIKK